MAAQMEPLRHKIQLQIFQTTLDDETGNRSRTWVDAGSKIWASVKPISGREFIAAAATQSKVTTRIKVRYRTGITHEMRIQHRGQNFRIEAVLPDNESGLDYLTILCSEYVDLASKNTES